MATSPGQVERPFAAEQSVVDGVVEQGPDDLRCGIDEQTRARMARGGDDLGDGLGVLSSSVRFDTP